MSSNMRTLFLFFNLYTSWLLICSSQLCIAGDTLNIGQKILSNENLNNLVSAGKMFELGFFTPSNNGISQRYLGIWYHIQEESQQPQKQTVVWVANRDNPVAVDSIGVFEIAEDGNLVVLDTSGNEKRYWFSNSNSKIKDSSSFSPKNRTVKLMDSGNLVLYDDELMEVKLWESFENPTDTFLLGMNMDKNLSLTSWKGADDPSSGDFTFKTMDNRFIILNRSEIHWESEEHGKHDQLDDISFEVYNLLTNFSFLVYNSSNKFSSPEKRNRSVIRNEQYNNKRLFLNSTGVIQWVEDDLPVIWKQPRSKCLTYNACGNFASCNDDDSVCKCLPGFYNDNQGEEDSSRHCTRRKTTFCSENDMKFLNLTMIKTGKPDKKATVESQKKCADLCHGMCPQCQAYSYAQVPDKQLRGLIPSNCWIWTQSLTTLKEEYTSWDDDRRLIILVDKLDIEPTPRTCEPCGTNTVPYPLSTGPNCGDLAYFNFRCNTTTGQGHLSFTAANNVSYRVIRVDQSRRKFTLQNQDYSFTSCDEGSKRTGSLNVSLPFRMTSDDTCSEQLVVSWEPPSEPICNNSVDCHGWKHSTCSKGKRCLCNANYNWNGESLICTKTPISSPTSTKEPNREKSKSLFYLILGLSLFGVVALVGIIIFAYACRGRIAHMIKQDKDSVRRNIRGRFYDSERHVKDLIDMEGLEENDNEGIEVPYFDFESILVATDDFSDANKLGKGGFGPVYKGKLGGQEIAVKRLSNVSSQGLQEFKNEVVLIAKLQHRNLVKLRGYCVKGEEKILLYEYMPNKSLDLMIFDSTKSVILDWPMRFEIILGIARGLLYLHQDSRLRVIHRDLKTSNILLDEEMQPKISDFGLARIVGGKETEASTERVVGTYGYMSPEYALDGYFSTKSDVFSFGVVLLEIISGKKNTGFYRSKEISSLLGYAWRLWREDKLQDLMDPTLSDTYNVNQFIRCSQIGLLCVQDEPDDRPHMSNVVTMLDNETTTLLTPKQPTFFTRNKDLSSTASSSLQLDSIIEEGR